MEDETDCCIAWDKRCILSDNYPTLFVWRHLYVNQGDLIITIIKIPKSFWFKLAKDFLPTYEPLTHKLWPETFDLLIVYWTTVFPAFIHVPSSTVLMESFVSCKCVHCFCAMIQSNLWRNNDYILVTKRKVETIWRRTAFSNLLDCREIMR